MMKPYKTYDSTKGFGNRDKWREKFFSVMSGKIGSPEVVLGLSSCPTREEIKSAFKKLIIKWHPDKNQNNLAEAQEMSSQLIAAYTSLIKKPITATIKTDNMIPTTKKGHGMFEASSAFQKAIRRGDEEQALYWAIEFFMSGLDEYCWKRMKIISSEDVGLAEPFMPANIAALYQSYSDLKKKNGDHREERLFYIHAVLLLVRAKKSRMVDYTLLTYFRNHEKTSLVVPDYAYDMHTSKGKSLGRGVDHFFKVGAHLENHAVIEGEEEMKKRARAAMDLPAVKFEPRKKSTKSNGLFED